MHLRHVIGQDELRPIVKVTLNLSLSRCMFFAHCLSIFYPILMKFHKR